MIDPDLANNGDTQGVTTRSECAVVAATGRHVDDLLFVGRGGNKVWEEARKRLQDYFRWKMWESDNFTCCGVRLERLEISAVTQ